MEQVSDHFTALLLASGYTEGSFDYKKNCHNLDGNVYKYPRYLRKFMESGVFKVRSDFFLPDAKNKALEFAEKYGSRPKEVAQVCHHERPAKGRIRTQAQDQHHARFRRLCQAFVGVDATMFRARGCVHSL